jgi:hypothetical protein
MSRARKSPRNARRAKPRPIPVGVQHISAPKTRLKPLFRLSKEVAGFANHELSVASCPTDVLEKRLFRFDAAVLERGVNALKSVVLLCGEAHWESASGILRQLFEIVVNMEYLGDLPDREEAIFRYQKYGLKQRVEFQRNYLLYGQRTGRAVDPERVRALERMLDEMSRDFSRTGADGKPSNRSSWKRHKVAYLAQRSVNPMRKHQYDILFWTWSEQMHGAPTTLIDSVLGDASAEKSAMKDDLQIVQTLTMAITLFLELWMVLPNAPKIDPEKVERWTAALLEQGPKYGA